MQHLSRTALSWASILDENTRNQAVMTADMPFIYPHLALMPDAHLGKGATVGSVIPTVGALIPAAVGVDIGCGMMAVKTQFTVTDLPADLKPLRLAIEKAIPLSAGGHNQHFTETAANRAATLESLADATGVTPELYKETWANQIGTLGSGNHFIEISKDENNAIWLFLHSGSRGVGNMIGQHHIKVARGLMEKWFISLPDLDLAYLVEGTAEFDAYLNAMRWAQEFAVANRCEMMDRVANCLTKFMGTETQRLETINCHHNYTNQERHYGKEVWLTRKGAISADVGELGLIPGSMGDKSYVVKGRGNAVALRSAPHGAGRQHSRNKAKSLFTLSDLEQRMGGIEFRHTDAFIDEIPDAYKPIDQVMQDSQDLVEIVHTLRQLVNVKGN